MSENYPKISIVSPSYNQGGFIEDAIQSVLNQNYPNFEHIIIDNCSSDKTASILNKYSHLRVISEPDKGQSDALNKGFKIAEGSIIGWLNVDDYYYPNVFHTVSNLFSQKDIDGIYANVEFIGERGEHLRYLKSHKPSKWLILFYCFIQSTTFFFSRKILDKGIFIDENMHLNMDKEFFAHLLHTNHKLLFEDQVFAAFRWHGENKSTMNKKTDLKNTFEGITILNRYSGFNIKQNLISTKTYQALVFGSKFYRQLLKVIS